jgi:hypothetical protein
MQVFRDKLEREQARAASLQFRQRNEDKGLFLLKKGEEVHLRLNQCVKIEVDPGKRLKFDPPFFIGYIVARDLLSATYIVGIVRSGTFYILDRPYHRPELWCFDSENVPAAWSSLAAAASDALAKGGHGFHDLIKQCPLRTCTPRLALTCRREGFSRPHLGCACTDADQCDNPQQCPCRAANRTCGFWCHSTPFG